ncbi:hypothetical protein BX600DRAFT_515307 [Xylariales sp. PMI_506]|nr:hypothetical protein BX600DRAFT_515307 [Xylariales sp. PMI_506]
MSFGFGIGDFLTVIELATRLRKEFADAPGQFQAISDEVKSLSILLQDVEVDLTTCDLAPEQLSKLQVIVSGSRAVLIDLLALLKKYELLRDQTRRGGTIRVKRVWQRLSFDADDLRDLRDRLVSNVLMLRAFSERDVRGTLVRLGQHIDDERRQQILDWVSRENPSAQLNDLLQRCVPGTRRWLLESRHWQNWINTKGSTLYCPGIPGAGKTFTTAMAIQELQRLSQGQDKHGISLAYVFCNYQRHDNEFDHVLARSLLRMLMEQLLTIPKDLSTLYDACVRTRRDLTSRETWKFLQAVSSLNHRTICIVDALDELETSQRNSIVENLLQLQSKVGVNLFFTSRKIAEIQDLFLDAAIVEVRATDDDVLNYLTTHMRILPACVARNKALQEEIQNTIIGKVDGMFLLAELYLTALKNKITIKAIRTALDGFSSGSTTYQKAYAEAMRRIQSQGEDTFEIAKTTFLLLTHARCPLLAAELCDALGTEPQLHSYDTNNVPDIEDILSLCAGLVIRQNETNIVQLVHRSTQEYFEATSSQWFPHGELDMRNICLIYLDSVAKLGGGNISQFPFLRYAQQHWGYHSLAAEKDQNLTLQAHLERRDILPPDLGTPASAPPTKGIAQLGLTQIAKELGGMDALFIWACKNNKVNILQILLYTNGAHETRTGNDSDFLDNENGSNSDSQGLLNQGLMAAVRTDQVEVFDFLVDHGAQLEINDGNYQNLLALAAAYGSEKVLLNMIDRGVCDMTSLLCWADCATSDYNFKKHQELDEELDIHIDTYDDDDSYHPRGLSFHPVDLEHIRDLRGISKCRVLDRVMYENDKKQNGLHVGMSFIVESPLALTALNGNRCTELLVNWMRERVDDNELAFETNFVNALVCAIAGGHLHTVKTLICLVNDPELKLPNGFEGASLFGLACRWDEEEIALFLLEAGWQLFKPDINLRTPLSYASEHGLERVVEQLLRKGKEDIMFSTDCGPLMRTSRTEFDKRDSIGRTPISYAAERGRRRVIEMLFADGQAKVKCRDYKGKTPADYAFENNAEDCYQYLYKLEQSI